MTGHPDLVHGMEGGLVEPHWPPLGDDEVSDVLAVYPECGPGTNARIVWRSPRPMSAAALVAAGGSVWFVKRHSTLVRTMDDLATEHRLAAHLRDHGFDLPEALADTDGGTVVGTEEWLYEVHRPMSGDDLYRRAESWTPYFTPGHARSAGAALAGFHRAAAGFDGPPRRAGPLVDSDAITSSPSPLEALDRWVARRPALIRYFAERPGWQEEAAATLGPALETASSVTGLLDPAWTHGDWHPSNLAWSSESGRERVCGAFDLGLANRTSAAHDLAVAVERAGIDWLAPKPSYDWRSVQALLDGYQDVGGNVSGGVVAAILPVAHVEYALSEIDYFAGVVGAEPLADLACRGYLLGHVTWFGGPVGGELLDRLRRR